jgi:D-beta-D-heptose 7-phosphate kinase / D-beta-D-heptose 1-phosphate adenosyltransferase
VRPAAQPNVVVIGDTLLDRDIEGAAERVCPDAPAVVVDVVRESARAGGAGLAAALAAVLDARVTLVTALGDDAGGAALRELLSRDRVQVVDLGLRGPTPEKVRVRARGTSIVRIDRGAAATEVSEATPDVEAVIAAADAVLVSDYGRGMTAHAALRLLIGAAARRRPVVWDPHPNGARPVAGMQVITPNQRELLGASAAAGITASFALLTSRARALAKDARAHAVAVTVGERGAMLVTPDGAPLFVPTRAVSNGDVCGAGDCFAAATAVRLASGAVLSEAVEAAVSGATEFVADGGASSIAGTAYTDVPEVPPPVANTASDVVTRVRAAGGVVVAAGGCFDLLHVGHVEMLRAARRLGDCLVVLLNSDNSVRRLKGMDRPLQPAADRAAVLHALDCVDAVETFDSDTPVPALERLRPDIFAKGGDYAGGALPEAAAMDRWGGQVVVLPYLAGHSTSRLLEEAARHVHD